MLSTPPLSMTVAGEGWELFIDLFPLGLRGLTGKQNRYVTSWRKRVIHAAVWRAGEYEYGIC